MIVVSDTSPILNLAIIDRLELLQDLFQDVIIPTTVAEELVRYGVHPPMQWMRIIAAVDTKELNQLRERLDPGEAEAIFDSMIDHAGFWIGSELRASSLLQVGEAQD